MLADKPWFKTAMIAFWILCLGSLYFSLYNKLQYISGCYARLDKLQLIETQTAQTETQLNASEAALDAAEAQLDKAK